MSRLAQCDNCGKTTDFPGGIDNAFSSWLTVSISGGTRDKHFCDTDCLREWSTQARIAMLEKSRPHEPSVPSDAIGTIPHESAAACPNTSTGGSTAPS